MFVFWLNIYPLGPFRRYKHTHNALVMCFASANMIQIWKNWKLILFAKIFLFQLLQSAGLKVKAFVCNDLLTARVHIPHGYSSVSRTRHQLTGQWKKPQRMDLLTETHRTNKREWKDICLSDDGMHVCFGVYLRVLTDVPAVVTCVPVAHRCPTWWRCDQTHRRTTTSEPDPNIMHRYYLQRERFC